MSQPPLALLLLRASRWFDRRLLDGLAAAGWPRLTPAQSLLFAHLDERGTAPATLARRLGTTRQGTQELVAGLVRHDLLSVQDDPGRRRGRVVLLTETGQALTAHAKALLDDLEASLGRVRVDRLRELLTDLDEAADAPLTAPVADVRQRTRQPSQRSPFPAAPASGSRSKARGGPAGSPTR